MTYRPTAHAGTQPAERGWDQGAILQIPRAAMSYLRVEDASGNWVRSDQALDTGDQLVVVSQICDIVRNPEVEPYVEAARAFWTTDRTVIRNAKTNSVRSFCLQRGVTEDGQGRGLIVDATFRIYVRKQDLLHLTSNPGLDADDKQGRARFRQWLGARYNRQPIPDHLVDAVQRPVVDGLKKLRGDNPLWRVLDGIGEIIYSANAKEDPYRIEMYFLKDEYMPEPAVSQTDVDRLAEWVANALKKAGKAILDYQELTDLHSISAHDYATLYQLPLDSYSLPDGTG